MSQNRRAGSDDGSDDFDRQTKQTGFSVSSSAMHRNTQLRLLDDRFEKIEEEYADDDDESEYDSNAEDLEERADFDAILDEFLEKYEIVGKKMQPKLEGETSAAKLDSMRQGLIKPSVAEEEKKEMERTTRQKLTQSALEPKLERPVQRQRETWDVQSVISTYSNLENHPSLINDKGPSKRIRIDPKTGMPVLVEVERKQKKQQQQQQAESDAEEDDEEEDEEDEEPLENKGAPRSKAETKEEKRARKQAIKDAKKVTQIIWEMCVENRNLLCAFFLYRIVEKRKSPPNPHLKPKRIVKRRFCSKSVKQRALPIFLDLSHSHTFILDFLHVYFSIKTPLL